MPTLSNPLVLVESIERAIEEEARVSRSVEEFREIAASDMHWKHGTSFAPSKHAVMRIQSSHNKET